ncbi:MAG: transaldolase family protein, partial [Mesorhizobium sp.]
ICEIVKGPVSAEVVATEYKDMMAEANILARIADNVCIKVPLTLDGLRACKDIRSDGRMVNVTLCFSATQALLAAKAGASFISPFVGRIDDSGWDGMELISDIRTIYDNYDFQTEILTASVRTVNHVKQAALIGADVITAPPATLKALVKHPLTDKGLEQFLADWAKTGQKIG